MIRPSLVRGMILRAYRSQRLKLRTFQYLVSRHSLDEVRKLIEPHYLAFAQSVNSVLAKTCVEMDFDAIPWTSKLLDEEALKRVVRTVGGIMQENDNIVDILLFRHQSPRLYYEHRLDGLIFAGLSRRLSYDNIH